jgi:hypothetical protein
MLFQEHLSQLHQQQEAIAKDNKLWLHKKDYLYLQFDFMLIVLLLINEKAKTSAATTSTARSDRKRQKTMAKSKKIARNCSLIL